MRSIPPSSFKPHNQGMNWYTAEEAQTIEDNMTGWRGSESLVKFRALCPRHSGFTRAVLALNNSGVPWEQAQWAAGEATIRLEQDASAERITSKAHEILEAYYSEAA